MKRIKDEEHTINNMKNKRAFEKSLHNQIHKDDNVHDARGDHHDVHDDVDGMMQLQWQVMKW